MNCDALPDDMAQMCDGLRRATTLSMAKGLIAILARAVMREARHVTDADMRGHARRAAPHVRGAAARHRPGRSRRNLREQGPGQNPEGPPTRPTRSAPRRNSTPLASRNTSTSPPSSARPWPPVSAPRRCPAEHEGFARQSGNSGQTVRPSAPILGAKRGRPKGGPFGESGQSSCVCAVAR